MINSKIFEYNINGIPLSICDLETSCCTAWIKQELENDSYQFEKIGFKPGDIVLEIGGNVGMVAIYLAIKYGTQVFSYEPIPENNVNFNRNITLNKKHVFLHKKAIWNKSEFYITLNKNNTGSSRETTESGLENSDAYYKVPAITLEQAFIENYIDKCKLLKMDCEGAEYTIFQDFTAWDKIEYLTIEIHTNFGHAGTKYEGTPQLLIDELKFRFGDRLTYFLYEGN